MQTATPSAVSHVQASVSNVQIESLTISRDVMPHHYVARAVILDLEPAQMVAAIIATMDAIKTTHPNASRSGWRASSDGLRIYFYEWTTGAYSMPWKGGR